MSAGATRRRGPHSVIWNSILRASVTRLDASRISRRIRQINLQEKPAPSPEIRQNRLLGNAENPLTFKGLEILHGRLDSRGGGRDANAGNGGAEPPDWEGADAGASSGGTASGGKGGELDDEIPF